MTIYEALMSIALALALPYMFIRFGEWAEETKTEE